MRMPLSRWMETQEGGRVIRGGILYVTSALLAIGVVMIYSASGMLAHQKYGDSMFFLKKHLIFMAGGLAGAVGMMLVDLEKLKSKGRLVLWAVAVVLGVTLVIADEIGGARRWIRLGWFNIQPSEFAKIAVVIYLANRLSFKDPSDWRLRSALIPLLWPCGILSVLVLAGKDLGTTVVMGSVVLLLLLAAGTPKKYFLTLVGTAIPVFVGAIWMAPYRRQRIMAFLNPLEDIQGKGFQLYQSLMAIGSGGWWGAGLGASQQKMFYLPEAHTDFIFAILGEELGFLGAGGVILLLAALGVLGSLVVARNSDPFKKYLALGLVSSLMLDTLINIGVSVGALPTKGLALPFISYGGSALVSKLMTIGLLLNVARDTEPVREKPEDP